ncbi:AsmA-like C-terminal region-containing protein [Paraflavitalea pollutisoli]|uniref:AsmA-like C-terminal region-containing protein n=1 Tax=Paraflavitalea pollutisoli TaxID=3034143 RepID=UPI0023EE04EF|nr:AsmA-like C-terminal region-containing protein [Paraflavitalea sp. H1-2-19X]
MLKKILKITGISLLVLVVILFTAPFIFKGKIVKIAKEQINKNINAKADFKDVSISFFRRFPRVSLALEGLQVTGLGEFAKDTLISAKEIDVAVNLFSVFSAKDMKVYAINVDEPRIHALVNKDGKANWDIVKPDTATVATPEEPASPFKLNLQKYAIKNGYLYYEDASAGMSSEIVNLNHEGSGDFTADNFILQTGTTADAVTFNYGGIPYLARTKTAIDADLQIDMVNSKYSFKTDEIAVNDLKLSSEGFFQLVNDSTYNMDIAFKAPSTEFKSILSLVPAVYQQDFAKIETKGKAIFDGFVKGTYSPTQIPAYNINLGIQDGFFKYPDLPQPVKNINLELKVNNPDGVTDNTVVNIPKAHIEFGNDPFDFHLELKKPMTDQYIDAGAKGKLNLASITQFVKLPDTKLSGTVSADVTAKGNMAVVTQQKPGEFSAKGFVDITNLFYASKDFPQPIQNTNARINIDNPDGVPDHTTVHIPAAHVEVGKDAADITLLLKTPASDPYFEGTVKGGLNLANIAQFYAFEAGTSLAGLLNADLAFKGKKSYIDKSQYEAFQTSGTIKAANVVYKSKDYPDGVTVSNTGLTFNPKNVTLNTLVGNFMGTNFNANGSFDNLIGYAMKDEPLAGTLNVSADKVDLNKLMGATTDATDTATVATESAPFAVPKNIQLTLNTKVDQVKYDKVEYKNISGTLALKDETVALKDLKMNALDGNIGLNGSYSTRLSKTKPDITLAYDVQNLDVQKTFTAFNTVQKLMPIGQFIAGKLTSKMTMKGKLGEDMMPDLSSLTGEGTLFLLEGFLAKFQPLEKLASTLNINELQSISVKDIKNYFEFANGKVLIKPFNVKVKDIDMEVGGMHGLDQSLDYVLNLKVPRAKLGEKANSLVNNLASQANSKGIPVKLSDIINFKVNVGGSITSPTIKTDLKDAGSSLAQDMKDQANEFVEAKKAAADSAIAAAKQATKDSIASAKNQVVKGLKDELGKAISGQKDTTGTNTTKDTKKALEETGKGLLNNLLKKKKPTDSVKQ